MKIKLPTKPGPYYWRESDGDAWDSIIFVRRARNSDKQTVMKAYEDGYHPRNISEIQGEWLPIPTAAELVELQAAKKMVDDGAEIVSCNNKPPMTVWLTGKQTPCGATNEQHDVFSPYGPYVHLEQFMEKYYGH